MSKSNKRRKMPNNRTKKICPISLKAFEKEYSKKLSMQESNKLTSIETFKKSEFAKELLSRFAPSSIEPNNNFYDYINYLWFKNVSLEKQQKYIVQIDDFRLAQDRVYRELNDILIHIIINLLKI
jgi:hypothetical protein